MPDRTSSTARAQTPMRWVITLCEPAIATTRRERTDAELRALAQKDPVYVRTWFAGVLSDVAASLPTIDPWTRLSARVRRPGADLVRLGAGRPPAVTGATGARGVFGSWEDATDLIPATSPDISTDIALAALSDPLRAASAAVLAFAPDGPRAVADALEVLAPGASVVDVAGDALRWAIFRRRIYVGLEDPYLVLAASRWVHLAAAPLGEGAGGIPAERIDDAIYRALTGEDDAEAGGEPGEGPGADVIGLPRPDDPHR